MRLRSTQFIILSIILGILIGILVNKYVNPENINIFSTNIRTVTSIFLRLIQMIVSPLVLISIVIGLTKLGEMKQIKRIGKMPQIIKLN